MATMAPQAGRTGPQQDFKLATSTQVVSKGPLASDLWQEPAALSRLKGSGPSLTRALGFGFRTGLTKVIEWMISHQYCLRTAPEILILKNDLNIYIIYIYI